MIDIFEVALATEEPKAKAAAATKAIVPIAVGDKITRLNAIRIEKKNLAAKEAALVSDIQPEAEKVYLEMYGNKKHRPDSFLLQSDDGGKAMMLVIDKYEKIEKSKEETIRELYKDNADDIIATTVEFKFDQDMLQKHGAKIKAALSAAITGLDIPDEDKKKVLKAVTSKCIKKGLIENLLAFDNHEMLFKIVKPQIQFKNPGGEPTE